MDYESHILQEYFLEARDILTDCEQAFLQLESHPEDESLIDTIFRLVHTLKGSAFVVGLDDFGRFAHRFENLLDLIRTHKLPITPETISLALQINDAQKCWLQKLTQDQHYLADVSSLNERMTILLAPFENHEPQPKLAAFGFFEDAPASEPTAHTGSRFQILLVDDSKEQLELYRDMLRDVPCDMHEALHGRAALEILRQQPMDVIVTDLEMPEMGGLQLIQEIRAADITTPIIFVSGCAGRQEVIKIANSGANGFLEKPVLQEALLAQVRTALREKYLLDVVAQLTQLNFRAYVTSSQLARIQSDNKRRSELEKRLVAVFEDIIHLQNELLRPKLVGQVL